MSESLNSSENLSSLVKVATEIAANQVRLKKEIRELLINGDEKTALVLVKELVGLYDEPISKPS